MKIYNQLSRPPADALKTIQAGRLKGKSDINPQWRIKAMTEAFGMVGVGWKPVIKRVWNEPGADDEVFAFAEVDIYVKNGENWSDAIPGIGGSKLVINEKNGMYNNDEGYKMAITDAFSTAMKLLGMAADIYAGLWDGSKYRDVPEAKKTDTKKPEAKKLALKKGDANWLKVVVYLTQAGADINLVKQKYDIDDKIETQLLKESIDMKLNHEAKDEIQD